MIGGVFEVSEISYVSKTVGVWNERKIHNWTFNFSDVQFLTPLSYKGTRIGIGDMVRSLGGWYEVYAYVWTDGQYWLVIAREKNYGDTGRIKESSVEDHEPLKTPIETITIGNQTYNKQEVEEALKSIKPIWEEIKKIW